MIAHVRGLLVAATADSVVVDVAGVGYRCLVPASTRARLPHSGQELLLHTSLQVREDSMTLFGFLTREEFDLFELLLKVEGIGPKVALSVISASTPQSLRQAIALSDVAALCRVPGIGKKTAQRIILELKEKVGAAFPDGDLEAAVGAREGGGRGLADARAEAMEAMVVLGYGRTEAAEALTRALKEAGAEPDAATLVRLGLKHLFRG